MILDDVDSDGHIEMVVGFDKVVRSYRFSSEDTASLSELRSPLEDPQCGGFDYLNYHVNICNINGCRRISSHKDMVMRQSDRFHHFAPCLRWKTGYYDCPAWWYFYAD